MTTSSGNGELIIEVYSGATAAQSAANLVQTLKVNVPAGAFPVPELRTAGTPAQAATPPAVPASAGTAQENWWSFSRDGAIALAPGASDPPPTYGRLANVNRAPGSNNAPEQGAFVLPQDVVRSVVPKHGDYRLVAARQTVSNSVFAPHPDYANTGRKLAHSLLEPVGFSAVQGADTRGELVDGATCDAAHVPDVPSNLLTADANSETRLDRGDWDNLPDFASTGLDPAETLDQHCKLRVIMNRKFAP